MKVLSITKRIMKQTLNDKRSLGLIIFAPIFLMTLIYLLLGDSNYTPSILEYNLAAPIEDELAKRDLQLEEIDNLDDGKQMVEEKSKDALLYRQDDNMYLLFESKDSVLTQKIVKEIQSAMKEMNGGNDLITQYLYGNDSESMFDSMGYIMLAIMSFFIIFILAGISFLRERTNQTMERLLLTPVKRFEVVLGYTLGFGFFALLESILLLIYVIAVLKMPLEGSVFDMALIMIMLSLSAVCIGAFFSIFSNNEFQVVQFIPIIVIPQIFFSGLISLDTIPFHMGYLSRIMPVYYACDALKSICIRGESYANITGDIIALIVFIVLFFFLNTLLLKKYRSI